MTHKLTLVKISLFCICISLLFTACNKDDDSPPEINYENGEVLINNLVDGSPISGEAPCNKTLRPIVMMHGMLASGDTYALQAMRFTTNDYCANLLYPYDWNSISIGGENVPPLDAFIDQVLAETGSEQVDLVGHSAGGGLGYEYLSDDLRAAKVAHYVHIGSNPADAPAGTSGQIPTLNIWSTDDTTVPGGDIPGATNVTIPGADHYQVATSELTFKEMFTFFNDQAPTSTAISLHPRLVISGKALTLGENAPLNGASIEIYELNSYTGFRVNSTPIASLLSDENGRWGPIQVKLDTRYEFLVQSTTPGDRPVHYYREPFYHSNHLVYLRTLPPPGSIASFFLGNLPNNADQTVMTIFASSQAVVTGRDELHVADNEISTPEYASADQTTIAFFLYDDGDQNTSLEPVGSFGNFPFLNGIDMFFPTTPTSTINLTMNGRNLNVPNWPSSEGVVVAVFD